MSHIKNSPTPPKVTIAYANKKGGDKVLLKATKAVADKAR